MVNIINKVPEEYNSIMERYDSILNYSKEMSKLLRDLFTLKADFDISEFVQKLGGELKLSDNISCDYAIQKTSEDNFTMYIPSKMNGKNFKEVVAHNLGHLFIHEGFKKDKWSEKPIDTNSPPNFWDIKMNRYLRGIFSQQETEADIFMVELLTPKEWIFSGIDKKGIFDVLKTADELKISKELVRDRIFYLMR